MLRDQKMLRDQIAIWLEFTILWVWISLKPDGWSWTMAAGSFLCLLLSINDWYRAKRAKETQA